MSNLILRRWLDLTKRQGSKSRRSGNKTKGGWAWRGRSRKFQSKGSLARVIGLAPMPLMSTMLLPPSELCVPGPRRNLCTPEAYAFVSEGLYHKFGGSNGMAWVNPLVTRVQKILFSRFWNQDFLQSNREKKERKSGCSHRSSIDRWHFPGERMECYMQKDRCPFPAETLFAAFQPGDGDQEGQAMR